MKHILELIQRIKFLFSDKLTINQILSMKNSEFTKYNGVNIKLYKSKGCDCVSCNRKGSYFLKEGRSYKLYTSDGMLMTKDHRYPKSKGGSDNIYNLEPMCKECNSDKADIVPEKIVNIKSEIDRENIIVRIKNISKLENKKSLSNRDKEKVRNYIQFLIERKIIDLLSSEHIKAFKSIPINSLKGFSELNALIINKL